MIILAFLFILAAAALALFMIFGVSQNKVDVHIEGFGLSLDASPLTLFLLGAVAMLLLGLGWSMLRHGSRRKWENRRELKRLRKAEREQDAATVANSRANDHVVGNTPRNVGAVRDVDATDFNTRGTGNSYVEDQRRL